ncbi:DUF423 domain-containing protein [Flavobacterium columnare NBRC 100251 = ATCC 23463]|uniref:DUF423 domain-containing protein n=2 Tax=Flavobacterium columnare TaxID=996 RepID=G8XAE8_FLACA|nr:DUF423 domain-containing protein [Flavobacterium columnare]AEW86619.1 hypothetical protein FCOL_09050 [Flavobacterium columnare ATCC 49512]AMO20518.1 DUF423 domain-containing protein [Flavobacterium columnare]ANO47026.1 hypothetical protein Pf1_01569 [Flavobacterium columnare]APT22276.1 hypothetical protein BU993_06310 [Flavobacterium columnare]AUX18487.1 hypothetical protein AQ623_09540 [Flavobacterium columnare]
MDKKILLAALLFGAVSIILGAFGAHALKKTLDSDQLVSFEVGVRYMMYHALFLLFLATTNVFLPEQKNIIFNLVVLGILFFSVSIFLLSTQSITSFNLKFLGPITPVGGILLISAWVLAFYYIFTKKI